MAPLMKAAVMVTAILLMVAPTLAGDATDPGTFVGEWEVVVTAPETSRPPYKPEVKHPVRLRIETTEGRLTGWYVDQFGYECDIPFITVINGGNDLLFTPCGTTKHPESFAPVHHVKLVAGRLHGIALTSVPLFEWAGTRIAQSN